MDYITHFRHETRAFEAAVRQVPGAGGAPMVPSCPDWTVSDLVVHLGLVHRYVIRIISNRLAQPPDPADLTGYDLPSDLESWPMPQHAPNRGPVPAGLIDWFADGAAALASLFTSSGPDERVWTWSREQTTGFWLRMQAIEAAVHRWDAEHTIGTARPVDAELARDAVGQNFTVMAPFRRAQQKAPPGSGEAFRFRQTDGTGDWTVRFNGDEVRLTESNGSGDVELAGTASDLMLFLWQRIPTDQLDEVTGDRGALARYFTLVPPM
jgi:uncharacterized protein (TIGR03083 family)